MPERLCSVSECDKPVFCREWCQMHYSRWLRSGDPGEASSRKTDSSGACSAPECGKPGHARGLCQMHYTRVIRTGRTELPDRESAASTYSGVHARLIAERGPASSHLCSCGAPAKDWAYQHDDPDGQRYSGSGAPYTTNLAHYEAMCHSCHTKLDRSMHVEWCVNCRLEIATVKVAGYMACESCEAKAYGAR